MALRLLRHSELTLALVIVALSSPFNCSAKDDAPDRKWRPGVDYEQLSPPVPTESVGGRVEVVEVFWYSCPDCYAFEPYLARWLRSKAEYVDFVRMPVQWRLEQRLDARLYYTLKSLGREDLHQAVYDHIHPSRHFLLTTSEEGSLALQIQFAQAHGVEPGRFKQASSSAIVNHNLEHAEQMVRAYRATATPSMVINGRYVTDVARAGGRAQLVALTRYLTGLERLRLIRTGPNEVKRRVNR